MFLEVVMLAVEVSSTNEVVAVGFRAAPLVRFFQKYNLPKDVLPVTELQSIPKFFREIRSVSEQKIWLTSLNTTSLRYAEGGMHPMNPMILHLGTNNVACLDFKAGQHQPANHPG